MKTKQALQWLIPVIAVLAMISAFAGLFWPITGVPFEFTTLHGQNAQMAGQGLYAFDTQMVAAGFRGTDIITLLVAIPLLVLAYRLFRQGSLRGDLLLLAALTFFLYNGLSLTFAAAFNPMYLVYMLLFSASLFAFIVAMTSIDIKRLQAAISTRMPYKPMAVFLFIAGGVVLLLWGSEITASLISGVPPAFLASYTTPVTHALDMGIIAPAAFLAGLLLWKKNSFGIILGFPLLVLNGQIGLCVISQTIMQLKAGVVFSLGQLIGMVSSWVVLAGFAVGLSISVYRNIQESAPVKTK
jgi:hypothetical protein